MKISIYQLMSLCLIFMGISSFTQKNSMKESATEVVIYKISAEKVGDYEAISKLPESFLQKQEGFISRKIYRDLKNPQIFLDIVEWESLEAGEKAAQNLEKDEALLPFLQATEEVISFSHYQSYP